MLFLRSLIPSLLLASASTVYGAASWTFEDATVSVTSKRSGVGSGLKESLNAAKPLSKAVTLGATDTLKIILTVKEGKAAKRPHQAFLTLTEPSTGLEESYAFSVKESGKGKVELTHKDFPTQFLTSTKPIPASLVIASFGAPTPYKSKVFDLTVQLDPNVPLSVPEKPLRYGKLEDIHHIFRDDPKSPPKIITMVFFLAVLVCLPALVGVWLMLGANVHHFPRAMKQAPVSHALFCGSILALEGIFFLYYTSWNLFQTLPAAAVVSSVAFLSGSRALTEVQERRLAGLR